MKSEGASGPGIRRSSLRFLLLSPHLSMCSLGLGACNSSKSIEQIFFVGQQPAGPALRDQVNESRLRSPIRIYRQGLL